LQKSSCLSRFRIVLKWVVNTICLHPRRHIQNAGESVCQD
jgi:hypothetical protein